MFLTAIFISDQAGAPMQRLATVTAVPGRGLEGDRYFTGTGYYCPRDVCQVTLIAAEALERMAEKFGVPVNAGEHRRNLVTRGVRHDELRGRRFAVGEVVMEYERPRPPCGYLERLTVRGMTRAMGEGAGLCAAILEGGVIREGDEIRLLPGLSSRPFRRLP